MVSSVVNCCAASLCPLSYDLPFPTVLLSLSSPNGPHDTVLGGAGGHISELEGQQDGAVEITFRLPGRTSFPLSCGPDETFGSIKRRLVVRVSSCDGGNPPRCCL